MDAMMRDESASTGSAEMSWFHGLSGGKTCSADRMASASGVSNITGFVIFGIGGGGRAPAEAGPGQALGNTAPPPAFFSVGAPSLFPPSLSPSRRLFPSPPSPPPP